MRNLDLTREKINDRGEGTREIFLYYLPTSLALAMLTHVSHANKALQLNWEREREREREGEGDWKKHDLFSSIIVSSLEHKQCLLYLVINSRYTATHQLVTHLSLSHQADTWQGRSVFDLISPLFNQVGQLRTSSHLQLQPGRVGEDTPSN